jgi:hypothetical protein
MKRHIILALIALTLVSYGGAQQQNLSNEKLIDNFAALVDTPATENPDENTFPELVFEDFDFEKADDNESVVVPQVLLNAQKIIINGKQVKITDGKKEITAQIDLKESYEDISSDGVYSWVFNTKDNDALPRVNYISIETNYPVEHMEQMQPYMGAEHAPLKITVDNIGNYYPKRFNQWKDIRRKLLANCPSNGEYYDNMDWANSDQTAEGLEALQSIDGDINHDGIDDLVRYGSKSKTITVYCFDAKNNVIYEKTFTVQNEYAKSFLEGVSIYEDGTIVIETEWINNRGASGGDDYTVRYQDDDLYLIGYDCQYEPYTIESYNLLTYQKETESGINDEEKRRTTSTLKKLPLKKLSDIKIGQYHCEDY